VAVQDRAPAQAVALVLGGVTSIQFGAALAATLFDDLGPGGTSLVRLVFAAIILVAIFRPAVRGRSAADLKLVAAFGLVLGAMNVAFYEALDRIPLGIAVTIEFLGPLGVAIAGSRRPRDVLWVAMAAAGIVLLADPSGDLDLVGAMFALVAAAFWGAYIVLAARAGPRFKGTEGVALAMVFAALVPIAPGLAQAGADLLDPELLALGCGVAILSSAIPYSLETEALRRIPRHVFGVLMSLEPALAALAGLLVLGQELGPAQLAAIGLVVAASAGASRGALLPEA
jgi:inner membrane transporter RhtA